MTADRAPRAPAFLRRWTQRHPVVPVLRLEGVIAPAGGALSGRRVNHASLDRMIETAFASKRLAAVALAINSPGGSPSQSALIARHIRRKAQEREVPVLAFCEDVAASGGYILACAADEIFVDEYSIMGSIGVITAGFGAHDAIARLGIERRLYTAGNSKSMLDPFLPEKAEDVTRIRRIQDEMHERFIAFVKDRRAGRLDLETPGLFEGDVAIGESAVAAGLADGVGHLRPVIAERYGKDAVIRHMARPRGLLSRLRGAGAALPSEAIDALEARLAWGRYGL